MAAAACFIWSARETARLDVWISEKSFDFSQPTTPANRKTIRQASMMVGSRCRSFCRSVAFPATDPDRCEHALASSTD